MKTAIRIGLYVASFISSGNLLADAVVGASPIPLVDKTPWRSEIAEVTEQAGAENRLVLAVKRNSRNTGGLGKNVDLTPLKGKSWVLTADVEGGSTSSNGAVIQALVRLEVPNLKFPIVRTGERAVLTEGKRSRIEMPLFIPHDAKRLFVGFSLSGFQEAATASISGVQLLPGVRWSAIGDERQQTSVDDFVEKVKGAALRAATVDWDGVRAISNELQLRDKFLPLSPTAANFVLQSLNDGHSHVLTPQEQAAMTGSQETAKNQTGQLEAYKLDKIENGYYLKPMAATFTDGAISRAFSAELRKAFSNATPTTCGWILDLRKNSGGNMYPTLSGLWPLLGDGQLGAFVKGPESRQWGFQSGAIGEGALLIQNIPYTGKTFKQSPVAVLIDRTTMSAAEAVAISFSGRPNTTFVGETTAGLTTANQVQSFQGVQYALATAEMADRNGKTFPLGVPPSEPLSMEKSDTGRDAARDKAEDWLQSKCTQHN